MFSWKSKENKMAKTFTETFNLPFSELVDGSLCGPITKDDNEEWFLHEPTQDIYICYYGDSWDKYGNYRDNQNLSKLINDLYLRVSYKQINLDEASQKFQEQFNIPFTELHDQFPNCIYHTKGFGGGDTLKLYIHTPTNIKYIFNLNSKEWTNDGEVTGEDKSLFAYFEKAGREYIFKMKDTDEDELFVKEAPEKLQEQLNFSFTKLVKVKKENGVVTCKHKSSNQEYNYNIEEKTWVL